eukprot:CAMPEP_0113905224 /NCGR_PEP_ID=MMETSP0780_2-20120614/23859_1 /TAXON_ID=652834 /ORGANISM="Palpitomonas bilix" /LENGTH=44 /DNA_ID=CAMNT_0000899261 /DNA_START=180 /DNA_END=311 /DNA_ORIENTATION=+ /assembly_acc=CAM_ASM_000599
MAITSSACILHFDMLCRAAATTSYLLLPIPTPPTLLIARLRALI